MACCTLCLECMINCPWWFEQGKCFKYYFFCFPEVAGLGHRDGPRHHHRLQHLQLWPAISHQACGDSQSARLPLLGPQPQNVRPFFRDITIYSPIQVISDNFQAVMWRQGLQQKGKLVSHQPRWLHAMGTQHHDWWQSFHYIWLHAGKFVAS